MNNREKEQVVTYPNVMTENDDVASTDAPHQVREQLELPLYEVTQPATTALTSERLGTFRDSLRAPIHRWFKYPAGFSFKLVEALIEYYKLDADSWLLDPFVGCGTTSVVAKQHINSVGVEAHPFVHWVARIKCFWEYDMGQLYQNIQRLLTRLHRMPSFPGEDTAKVLLQ